MGNQTYLLTHVKRALRARHGRSPEDWAEDIALSAIEISERTDLPDLEVVKVLLELASFDLFAKRTSASEV